MWKLAVLPARKFAHMNSPMRRKGSCQEQSESAATPNASVHMHRVHMQHLSVDMDRLHMVVQVATHSINMDQVGTKLRLITDLLMEEVLDMAPVMVAATGLVMVTGSCNTVVLTKAMEEDTALLLMAHRQEDMALLLTDHQVMEVDTSLLVDMAHRVTEALTHHPSLHSAP